MTSHGLHPQFILTFHTDVFTHTYVEQCGTSFQDHIVIWTQTELLGGLAWQSLQKPEMMTKVGAHPSNAKSSNNVCGMVVIVVDSAGSHVQGKENWKDGKETP